MMRRWLVVVVMVGCLGCSTVPTVGDRSAEQFSPAELYALARERSDHGDLVGAAELLEYIIQHHYDYEQREEVRYAAAEAWFGAERYGDAFEHYRRLLTEYPLTSRSSAIARRIWRIGVELIGRKSDFFDDFDTDHAIGLDALNYLVTTFPRSSYADDGWKMLAEAFAAEHHPEAAAEIYERLIQEYPDSEWVDLSMFRVAGVYGDLTRGERYDVDPLLWEHAALDRYLATYPDGNFATQARERTIAVEEEVARRERTVAEYYREIGSEEGERLHLSNAARRFPTAATARWAQAELSRRGWDPAEASTDLLRPRADRPVWRRASPKP